MRYGAAIALTALVGCSIHRGSGWEAPPPPRDEGVSLLLLGEVAPGRSGQHVAAELDRTLTNERAQGREPIVLWLGNGIFPGGPIPGESTRECVSSAEAWSAKGPRALHDVVTKHVRLGTPSFAVLGNREWRCGHPELALQESSDGPHPWQMPAHNYVVRIKPNGDTQVVSACSIAADSQCGVENADAKDSALVDLVMLDVSPWVFAPPAGSATDDLATQSLAQAEALIASLRRMDPKTAPPRILVTNLPIETAGVHGQGGAKPTAFFRQLPAPLKQALADGLFVGAVSAHDRSLQATADVSDAVKRSSRTWLDAPVFQVVSGASSRPDVHAAFTRRQVPYFTGMAITPDLYSNHAGFARVVLTTTEVDVVLHARRGRRWETGTVSFALERAEHPAATPSPVMTPCRRCDPVQGAASSDKVTDRRD